MDDDFIVTVYVVIAETLRALEHRDHPLAGVSDAEVLMVAVVAAKHFQNHHALALATLQRQGYGRAGFDLLRQRLLCAA